MVVVRLDDPRLQAVDLDQLMVYLERTGWHRRPTQSPYLVMFVYKEKDDLKNPIEIPLPTSQEYRGSRRRMAEAIRFLADFDDRSLQSVFNDIQNTVVGQDLDPSTHDQPQAGSFADQNLQEQNFSSAMNTIISNSNVTTLNIPEELVQTLLIANPEINTKTLINALWEGLLRPKTDSLMETRIAGNELDLPQAIADIHEMVHDIYRAVLDLLDRVKQLEKGSSSSPKPTPEEPPFLVSVPKAAEWIGCSARNLSKVGRYPRRIKGWWVVRTDLADPDHPDSQLLRIWPDLFEQITPDQN